MSIGRKAGSVSVATMVSRVFGLIRDQIFAALIGAGFYSDAFVIAFRIPNLLRDLFAEGALSSAFVPTFTEYEMKRSRGEAWALANLVLGALLALIGAVTILGIIFAPQLVAFIAPGFDAIPGKAELTILLTRIMWPFLLIIAASALFMGILNVHDEFTIPAFAPVLFNLVAIAFGLSLWLFGFGGKGAVIGWSIGTMCGGLAQGGIQLPRLLRGGWKIRPTLRGWTQSPGLKQIGILMLPAIIANSGTQVNVLVNSILASMLQQGSPSWLNYAFRLIQLPIGVFGVAIAVVTLSTVSKDAAADATDSFRENLTTSLNLVFLLTIPCAVGLWLLGEPIVRLIYERGAFHSSDTAATAAAVACYALGLPAYAAVKVKAPVFFALRSSKVPMMASLLGVVVNFAFNLWAYKRMGHAGLALGTSLAVTANLAVLLFWFQYKQMGLPLKRMGGLLLKVILSSGLMGVVAYTGYHALHGTMAGLPGKLVETLLPIAAAIAVYFGVLCWMKVPEAATAIRAVRRIYERFSVTNRKSENR
ncbi:MAG: murein biosynthesis integral membrane protein MurJ [Pseudomonadota bacterium]